VAMQKTGSAAYIADLFMLLFRGSHPFILLIAVAALASLLSLFISNVGSVVVLTPLVINIALISGLDPRPLVLLAAVSALNSFILPTHQVNALMMTAGGYRNSDYLKTGGGMTLIFIAVAVTIFYYLYI
jgi:di/tricarboxylate transporter